MANRNEKIVREAFDACKRGDKSRLRQLFAYNEFVQIQGACPPEDYPAGERDINYGPKDQGDGKVRTEVRWRTNDDKEYYAVVEDTVEDGKITASSVTWKDYPYDGPTEDDAAYYADKYGWWGWPFGRRRG